MSDNPSIDPGTNPTVPVEGDDIGGGVIRQAVTVAFGAKDASGRVTAANPLPVSVISNVAQVTDGSGFQHQEVVNEYLVAGVPQAVDASHPLPVTNTPSGTQTVSGTVAISGTVPISAAALPLPTGAALDATLTGGTQLSQVRGPSGSTAAVKAASTAAVAGDPALVVAVSPNNTPVLPTNAATATGVAAVVTALGTPMQATGGTVGLVAGSALVGKVGIDQTTPGTTNAVAVTNAFALDATLTGGTQQTKIVGGSTAVVKPASTVPAATDPALVVSTSPNSSPLAVTSAAASQADGHSATIGALADLSSASTLVGLLKAIKAAVTGTIAVSGTFWQATQPVSGTVTTTPPANASTNTAQVAGTTTDVNAGTISAGTQRVAEAGANTGTLTNVASSATSVTVLASNTARRGATVWNDSTAILYLKFGTTASTTSCTVKLVADAYYEVPAGYNGRIDGIWASATGTARVTEISA